MQDRVSIVIPVYNARRYIEECLESCLAQDYENFEVIAVDDKSTDGTLDVMHKYRNNLPLDKQNKLIIMARKINGHTGAAMNTGIMAMSGEWFKEMQADDLMLPNCLKDMVPAAKEYGKLDNTIFYADAHKINHKSKIIYTMTEKDRNDWTKFHFDNVLLQHNIGNGITVLIHRSAFLNHGYFNEHVMHEDYEHRLRWCVVQGARMRYIPVFVASYRLHDANHHLSVGFYEHNAENTRIKEGIVAMMQPAQRRKHHQLLLERHFHPIDDYLERMNLDTLMKVLRHPKCLV